MPIQCIFTAWIVYLKKGIFVPGLLLCSFLSALGSPLGKYSLQLPVEFFHPRVCLRPESFLGLSWDEDW